MLSTSSVINGSTTYLRAEKLLGANPAWKNVTDEAERKQWYADHIVGLRRKEQVILSVIHSGHD